jgi:hypothetical protein
MPNLGEELYPAESANLRGAARRWSDLRDVEALLETYDRLGACFADDVDRRRIAPVRRALVAPRRRSAESTDALERRAAGFRAELNAGVPGTRDAAARRAAAGDATARRPCVRRAPKALAAHYGGCWLAERGGA